MAASPVAAALAAALALAPPALLGPVPTDRFIVTDVWDAAIVEQPEAVDAAAPAPSGPDAPAEPAAEVVVVETVRSPAPEGPARAPAIDLGCHGSLPCQRLIALGSVAGGLGLAALAAGAALLVRPVAVAPDDPTAVITYRPAGAALLAVGTGLAATWLLTLLAARKASRIAQRRHVSMAVP